MRDPGPYDDAMLLFDYRTDHPPAAEQRAPPTFLYAMPLETDGGGRGASSRHVAGRGRR